MPPRSSRGASGVPPTKVRLRDSRRPDIHRVLGGQHVTHPLQIELLVLDHRVVSMHGDLDVALRVEECSRRRASETEPHLLPSLAEFPIPVARSNTQPVRCTRQPARSPFPPVGRESLQTPRRASLTSQKHDLSDRKRIVGTDRTRRLQHSVSLRAQEADLTLSGQQTELLFHVSS